MTSFKSRRLFIFLNSDVSLTTACDGFYEYFQALLELFDSGALKHFDEERILVLAANGKLYEGIFTKHSCRL
jgi:hypothetical protein